MRKLIVAAVLAVAAAAPAAAVEGKIIDNQDLTITAGYKMWLNSWSSWNTSSVGNHFIQFSEPGVANMFPFALKYKNFFTTLSFMFTGDYTFPAYTEANGVGAGTTKSTQMKASRNEVDWNVGYYVVPNQLGFTVGLKDVGQKWQGATNGAAFGPVTNWNWIGPTLGITGAASIGNGFSLYGNGVGGFMAVSQDPAPVPARNDSATYESAEMGIAWKAAKLPLSASFGYKYQRINTKLDINNQQFQDLRGLDVTSGYTLGFNVVF